MDKSLQTIILVFALAYKYLVNGKTFKIQMSGWICMVICSGLSIAYLNIFMDRPILLYLEYTFFVLSLYGTYKHFRKHDEVTWVDVVIVSLALIAITTLVFRQMQENALWYQIIASTSFLPGQLFLAQKKIRHKITGWLLFIIGGVCLFVVYYVDTKYVMCVMHVVSVGIGIYNIEKLTGWSEKIIDRLKKLKQLLG